MDILDIVYFKGIKGDYMAVPKTALMQVLELITEKYPNQLPKKPLAIEDLGRLIGQQDVVQYLQQHIEAADRKPNGR